MVVGAGENKFGTLHLFIEGQWIILGPSRSVLDNRGRCLMSYCYMAQAAIFIETRHRANPVSVMLFLGLTNVNALIVSLRRRILLAKAILAN